MGKIMVLNGSPRAPKSNSKAYADIFLKRCNINAEYFAVTKSNHQELCRKINEFSDVLLVFPLYADSIPVTLLNFLKTLEENLPKNKPVISVLINCGFLEYTQNDTAVEMIELFCKKIHCNFGSVLKIGSGEAILSTPFKFPVIRKIHQLAKSIICKKYKVFNVTMPISPRSFVKASAQYWIRYGKRNGITEDEMKIMKIEQGENRNESK